MVCSAFFYLFCLWGKLWANYYAWNMGILLLVTPMNASLAVSFLAHARTRVPSGELCGIITASSWPITRMEYVARDTERTTLWVAITVLRWMQCTMDVGMASAIKPAGTVGRGWVLERICGPAAPTHPRPSGCWESGILSQVWKKLGSINRRWPCTYFSALGIWLFKGVRFSGISLYPEGWSHWDWTHSYLYTCNFH